MVPHLYLTTICLPLIVVLIIFWMRYRAQCLQARLRHAGDDAYRVMAEKAVVAEAASTAALSAIREELGDLRGRLAAIEKILKDVE